MRHPRRVQIGVVELNKNAVPRIHKIHVSRGSVFIPMLRESFFWEILRNHKQPPKKRKRSVNPFYMKVVPSKNASQTTNYLIFVVLVLKEGSFMELQYYKGTLLGTWVQKRQ